MKVNININMQITRIMRITIALAALFFLPDFSHALVFPGAVGFGTDWSIFDFGTPEIFVVDNLRASGTGTLKECVDTIGPRICVFEVSGYIEYNDAFNINNPYIIIAGQTAPSPGITIRRSAVRVNTHHVLIQHIRVRAGDYLGDPHPSYRDAFSTGGSDSRNIVVDHNSFSWGTDETGNFGAVKQGTFSYNIVSEGLHDSLHDKGPHSKGTMLSYTDDVLAYRNLFAFNEDRNPYMDSGSHSAAVNNVMYGFGVRPMISSKNEPSVVTFIGNDVIRNGNEYVLHFSNWPVYQGSLYYIDNNRCDAGTQTNDDWNHIDSWNTPVDYIFSNHRSSSPPVWPDSLDVLPVEQVENHVLDHAGARPCDRDAVDKRVIEQVRSRKGYLVDCVEAGVIWFPDHYIEDAGSDWIRFSQSGTIYSMSNNPASSVDNRYEGMTIQIYDANDGDRVVLETEITAYEGDTKTAYLGDSVPSRATEYRYRIKNVCTKGAGGWPDAGSNPPFVPQTISHDLPSDPYANDRDYQVVDFAMTSTAETIADDYTNIEEWLYAWGMWWEYGACGDSPPEPSPEPEDTVFCDGGPECDRNNWEEIDWQGQPSDKFGLQSGEYGIIDTDITNAPENALAVLSLLPDTYEDFIFTADVRSLENLADNPGSDYAVVFGYQGAGNYDYVILSHLTENTKGYHIVDGSKEWYEPFSGLGYDDIGQQQVRVIKKFDTVTLEVTDNEQTASEKLQYSWYGSGRVGIGSVNDASLWDNIEVKEINRADMSDYGAVDMPELISFLERWKATELWDDGEPIEVADVMQAIRIWVGGR